MSNKIALITGGSKGLGRTLAQWLGLQGYTLILTARHADRLTATADDLRQLDIMVKTVIGDVTDSAHRAELTQIIADYGRLDVLVNNASTLGTLPMPTLADYPLDSLRTVFDVNVIAPIALTQGLLPYLKQANGLIVNLSSDAAVGGYETWGGYGASKAALDLVSATLANELADDTIAVVSVDPGDMRTDMHQDAFPNNDISDRPLPDATLPFWGWLFGQSHDDITGQRFQAQSTLWQVTQ